MPGFFVKDNNNPAVGASLAARSPIAVYLSKTRSIGDSHYGRVIDPGKEEVNILNHAVSMEFVTC